ncbi:MAG: hypothetical protein JSS28_01350 [Proteobacteria bacterium]|nr:hypothetical protein [Pseudomonadota bacterium]
MNTLHTPAPAPSQNSPDEALTWHTPVRFDPGVLKRLIGQHDLLDARVASLPDRFRHNRDDAWRAAHACASQLRDMRRQEAIWIYPVIAHGTASDAAARRRSLNLRFGMNGLARRALRHLEDLAAVVRQATDISAGVAAVAASLQDYRQRNESELYTLYCLMDPHQAGARHWHASAK